MNTLWAPFIQQLVPPSVITADQLLAAMASVTGSTTMSPTVDTLLLTQLPLPENRFNQLAALARAGVIDALVISSKQQPSAAAKLPTVEGKAPAPFVITLKINQQTLLLPSPQPLLGGTHVQLTLQPNNTVLITTVAQPAGSEQQSTGAASGPAQKPDVHPAVSGRRQPPLPHQATSGQPNRSATTVQRAVIEQSLRQSLPVQQPIDKLLPLLQQLTLNPPASWPKAFTNNLTVLLRQFPAADQLQQASGVRQALNNSGTFFEAKLAQQLTTATTLPANSKPAGNSASAPINYDIKGLLQRVIGQLEKIPGEPVDKPAVAPPPATVTGSVSPRPGPGEPLLATTAAHNPLTAPEMLATRQALPTATASADNNADVMLRQLGQQLLASLARNQMNQLETLLSRQAGSLDNKAPVNSWTLETPILQGNHIDNLSIRIDQQPDQQPHAEEKKQQAKQWTVMLAFDLHQLGKMNVQLKIVDQSVAATVWTEQQHAHREAQLHLQGLKSNLQRLGVEVTQIDCQLGLPTSSKQPLYTQLVDIRT